MLLGAPHLEQLLVHLGSKPVHEDWVGCIKEVGVGLGLAGVRVDDGEHFLLQRGARGGWPAGQGDMNTVLVPGNRVGLPVDDEAVHVDELARTRGLRTHGKDAGQHGRISRDTWIEWHAGIGASLRSGAFAKAWTMIKDRTPEQFAELKELEATKFPADPPGWKNLPRW